MSEIKTALDRLQGQAWYLFQGVDQRVFFGQTANVTAEITEIAANIAEEQVDQTLRDKLQEVFKPRTGALYADRMAILPALDEIHLDDDRPTLIILEQPADKLPQDFVDWWNKQDLQNRVLVLTADPNAVTTLRHERSPHAGHREGRGTHQGATWRKARRRWRSLHGVKEREAAGFTSALRETFKTIVFPMRPRRICARSTISAWSSTATTIPASNRSSITLEARKVHSEPTSSTPSSRPCGTTPRKFFSTPMRVQPRSLRRNAAVRAGWFWLPRGGLDNLIKTAVQRGFWREKDGLVAKKWERRTRVTARSGRFRPKTR